MHRFLLSNPPNTRDLGGYPIDYGKVTAYKVFLRSDAPIQVSDEDIQLHMSNLIQQISNSMLFDPEEVGFRLRTYETTHLFNYKR